MGDTQTFYLPLLISLLNSIVTQRYDDDYGVSAETHSLVSLQNEYSMQASEQGRVTTAREGKLLSGRRWAHISCLPAVFPYVYIAFQCCNYMYSDRHPRKSNERERLRSS